MDNNKIKWRRIQQQQQTTTTTNESKQYGIGELLMDQEYGHMNVPRTYPHYHNGIQGLGTILLLFIIRRQQGLY